MVAIGGQRVCAGRPDLQATSFESFTPPGIEAARDLYRYVPKRVAICVPNFGVLWEPLPLALARPAFWHSRLCARYFSRNLPDDRLSTKAEIDLPSSPGRALLPPVVGPRPRDA